MGSDPACLSQSYPSTHRLWRQSSGKITTPMTETQNIDHANTKLFPTQGKLMALDVGLARIGIALCDPLRLNARPHSTLTRASRRDDFAHLAKVVKTEDVQGIVCGLPLNMDGSVGHQA